MKEMLRQIDRIAELQQRFLPRKLPQLAGWHWAGYHRAGRRPGGDYYNLFARPDGRLAMFLGDASDHGAISAALVAEKEGRRGGGGNCIRLPSWIGNRIDVSPPLD